MTARLGKLAKQSDLLLLAAFCSLFFSIALIHIGFVPPPWQDEPWLMQPSYELLKGHGISLPMFRLVGTNMESQFIFNPAFSFILALFFKLFGFGIVQARVFNLIISVGVLVIVYLIARRLFCWKAGIIAVAALAFDVNYFNNSRFLRNDFLPIFLGLTSIYLYFVARDRDKKLLYLISGVLIALSVLSHLNAFVYLGIIALYFLIDYRRTILLRPAVWLFAAGALIFLLPYTIYLLRDIELFRQQWFIYAGGSERGISPSGMILNASEEWRRYSVWYEGILNAGNNATTWLKQLKPRHIADLVGLALFIYIVRRAQLFFSNRSKSQPVARRQLIIAISSGIVFVAVMLVIYLFRDQFQAVYWHWFNLFKGLLLKLMPFVMFQALTAIGLIYLISYLIRGLVKRGPLAGDSRIRLLLATLACVIFFATEVMNKTGSYLPYLTTWFSLVVGVFVSDFLSFLKSYAFDRSAQETRRAAYHLCRVGMLAAALFLSFYLYRASSMVYQYYHWAKNLDAASYDELAQVLRQVITEELTPAGFSTHWLAFSDRDDYIALNMVNYGVWEKIANSDDLTLIADEHEIKNNPDFLKNIEDNRGIYSLMAELINTAYGNIRIYYIGEQERYQNQPVKRFYFNGNRRGVLAQEQMQAAQAIKSFSPAALHQLAAQRGAAPQRSFSLLKEGDSECLQVVTNLSTYDYQLDSDFFQLEPETLYELAVDIWVKDGECSVGALGSDQTRWLCNRGIQKSAGFETIRVMFTTDDSGQTKIVFANNLASPGISTFCISGVRINEVGGKLE